MVDETSRSTIDVAALSSRHCTLESRCGTDPVVALDQEQAAGIKVLHHLGDEHRVHVHVHDVAEHEDNEDHGHSLNA